MLRHARLESEKKGGVAMGKENNHGDTLATGKVGSPRHPHPYHDPPPLLMPSLNTDLCP